MKHTKGPWVVRTDTISNEQGDMIAEVIENKEANARLIASAPELLEACKIVIMHLGPLKNDDVFHELVIKECEQAIKKAEGIKN